MKISEHANYLLNEYGRLQFDYAAYYKPYGESLRNEARNNLEEYIAELEGKIDQLIEVGDKLTINPIVGNYEERECEWQKLVQDWKEG